MEMSQGVPGTSDNAPKTAATEIYNSLKINESTQILLVVRWLTDKQ